MFDLTHRKTLTAPRGARFFGLAALTVCIGTSMAAGPLSANTRGGSAAWAPTSSERLVKLPMNYLKKTIEIIFCKLNKNLD